MDAFAERYLPVDGQTFLSRSGTWACELNGPVDVSGADRRIFYLQFNQIKPDRRWSGPKTRKLELRASLASFTHDPNYAAWLHLVIDGFLDSDRVEHVQEAYEVEREGARKDKGSFNSWVLDRRQTRPLHWSDALHWNLSVE